MSERPRHQLDPPDTTVLDEEAASLGAALDEIPAQIEQIATRAADRTSRWFGLLGVLVAIVLSLLATMVGLSVRADLAANSAADTASQQQTEAALARLADANRALEERGQAPVDVPPDPAPADAIAAAVLAQVLQQLPPGPSADEVADRLRAAVLADVLGDVRPSLAAQAEQYLRANPPAAGPPGRDGQSPPCLDEAAQCRGADGRDGKDGADSAVPGPKGDKGDPGSPGAPPAGWTQPGPLGTTETCARTPDSPDSAPTYTCS